MPEVTVPIIPGSMYSDVDPSELTPAQHQLVTNFRLEKDGQWRTVKGYLESLTGATDIRAAVEMTDDQSGDRYIIYQDSYGASSLKILAYDSGDGDGYENETPSSLTLPSGVTIGDVTLRFHVFRGVVRISGASQPLWYAYKDKTLFSDLWRVLDEDIFTVDSEGWTVNGAGGYVGDNTYVYLGAQCLKVTQTALNTTIRKSFTTVVGSEYRVRVQTYREADGKAGDPVFNAGTTAGGSDYGSETDATRAAWVLYEITFTATGTTGHIELNPGLAESTADIWMDWVIIEEQLPIDIDDRFLHVAEVTGDELTYTVETERILREDTPAAPETWASWYYALFFIYDNGQCSMPIVQSTEDTYLDEDKTFALARRFTVVFDQDDYEDSCPRVTGVGLLVAKGSPYLSKDDPSTVWYVADIIDTVEGVEPTKKSFIVENWDNVTGQVLNSYATDVLLLEKQGRMISDSYALNDAGEEAAGAYAELILNCYTSRRCKLSASGGSLETQFSRLGDGSSYEVNAGSLWTEIYFDEDVSSLITSPEDMTIDIWKEPSYVYDSGNEIHFTLTVDCMNMPSTTFHDYSGIPLGTLDTNPDYSHHTVVDGLAYVNSEEDDEEDRARYSPTDQYDVFPNGQLMRTEIGDADQIKAILNRDNRVVALKRNSISQMQWSGSRFYSDIGLANSGLYPTNGWIVVDHILYYMDESEVFAFTGMQPKPLLEGQKIRDYYAEHVDEDSFFVWNKKQRELWLILDTVIMVFQVDKGNWYVRDTDAAPVCGFLTFDNNLYLAAPKKFVRFNHSETTFDENIQASFVSRINSVSARMEQWKKVKSIDLFAKGNCDVTVTFEDLERVADGEAGVSETITPNASDIGFATARPQYLFNTLQMTAETEDGDDTDVTIRHAQTLIHVGGKS